MKRVKRPCDAELAGWWPDYMLGDDAPATKRAQFSRTTYLLQELERQVAAALHTREQKDALERAKSLRLAERYPLQSEASGERGRGARASQGACGAERCGTVRCAAVRWCGGYVVYLVFLFDEVT